MRCFGLLTTVSVILVLATSARAQPPPQPAGEPAQAQQGHYIEAYLSEDALQGQYVREMEIDQVGRTVIGGGVFFNEDRDLVAMGTALSIIGASDRFRRFSLRAGPRLYGAFLNGEDEDIFGIGIGGEARYLLGSQSGSAIVLTLFYAPDIVVFGAADGVEDVSVRFEMGLRGDTTVFVGYRLFEMDLDDADRKIDDAVHVGLRYQF